MGNANIAGIIVILQDLCFCLPTYTVYWQVPGDIYIKRKVQFLFSYHNKHCYQYQFDDHFLHIQKVGFLNEM
jgi:hypothetical protein